MKLAEIVDATTGYKLFSERQGVRSADGCFVLQLRDIDERDEIDWTLVERRPATNGLESFKVEQGDVLFAPRSARVAAIVIGPEIADRLTIASSHFYILRPKADRIRAGYLAWLLNHPQTRRWLATENRGTHLPFVPLNALQQLDVPLPSLDVQKTIVQVDTLRRREHDLTRELLAERDTLIAANTWRLANEN